jgi:hypothetical protein
MNFMIYTISQDYNFNLFDNYSLLYISLFDVRLHEDDLKKTKTCQCISGLYVEVCILILVHM